MKNIVRILITLTTIALCYPMLASDQKATATAVNSICPVSGSPVGDLGTPTSAIYKGQTIMLCCKTCLRKFNANPEKYVAILNQSASKK